MSTMRSIPVVAVVDWVLIVVNKTENVVLVGLSAIITITTSDPSVTLYFSSANLTDIPICTLWHNIAYMYCITNCHYSE